MAEENQCEHREVVELKIGKVAQRTLPVLFAEGRVSEEDIAFLMSDAAIKRFKTSGNQVLKVIEGDPETASLDERGRRRFYSRIVLEANGRTYLMTSQWFAPGLEPFLAWLAEHGMDRARVEELYRQAEAAPAVPQRNSERGRAPRSNIRVTFPDGTVLEGRKAADVFAQAIEKIGADRVAALGILHCGEPLISNNVADYVKYAKALKSAGNGWFVNTYSSTQAKAQFLERIGRELDVGLQVEIVGGTALEGNEAAADSEVDAAPEDPAVPDMQMPDEQDPDERRAVECPNCHGTFDTGFGPQVHLDGHPELVQKLTGNTFFKFPCPKCQSQVTCELETVFFRQEKRYLVLFTPERAHAEDALARGLSLVPEEYRAEIRQRVATTRTLLAEKVRIFEAGLDDHLVEFIKSNVMDQITDMDVDFALFYGVAEDGLRFGFWPKGRNEPRDLTVPMEAYEKCVHDFDGWFAEGHVKRVDIRTVRASIESRRVRNAVHAMYHDKDQKKRCECPHCHHPFEVPCGDTFDLAQEPGLEERILDGTLFDVSCPVCHKPVSCERPVVVANAKKGYLIRVANSRDEARRIDDAQVSLLPEETQGRLRERNVVGAAGLLDKVAIFEAGLDDNVVEAMKMDVYEQMKDDSICEILFRRTEQDGGLTFDLFRKGAEEVESVTGPKGIYERLTRAHANVFGEGWVRYVSPRVIREWACTTAENVYGDLAGIGGKLDLWTPRSHGQARASFAREALWRNSVHELTVRIVDTVRDDAEIAGDFSMMTWIAVFSALHFGLGASVEWQNNPGGYASDAIFDMMMAKGGFCCVGEISYEKLGSFATPVFRKRFGKFVEAVDGFARQLMSRTGFPIPAKGAENPRRALWPLFFKRLYTVCSQAFECGFAAGWLALNKGAVADEGQGILVEPDYEREINLALAVSRLPLVKSLRIRNTSAEKIEHLTCVITSPDDLFERMEFEIGTLFPDRESVSGAIPVKYNVAAFKDIVAVQNCCLCIKVLAGSEVLFSKDYDIKVAAPDIFLWKSNPMLFAAFATPNAAPVRVFHSHVSREMGVICDGNAEIYTYQDEPDFEASRRHSLKVCEAIYRAVHAQGITYADPPPANGIEGQRVRLAADVLVEKSATCLDSTLLFASLMEEVGLNPVLMLIEGHAFIGCHLINKHFPRTVMERREEDLDCIAKAVQAGNFIAIETTRVGMLNADTGHDYTFAEAVEIGRMRLGALARNLRAAVDVVMARNGGVHELTLSRPGQDMGVDVVAREVGTLPVKPERPKSTKTGVVRPQLTGRVKAWADKLLQLSPNNALLNCARAHLVPLHCLEKEWMYAVEDALSDGKPIWISSWEDLVRNSLTSAEREELERGTQKLNAARIEQAISEEFAARRMGVEAGGRTKKIRGEGRRRGPKPEWQRMMEGLEKLGRDSREETGAQTLYAAIGFVEWSDSEPRSNRRAGETYKAPILLVPIVIDTQITNYGMRIVKRDDDSVLNETLVQFLETAFSIRIDDFKDGLPTDDHGLDVEKIIQKFCEYVEPLKKGLRVVDGIALGHFTSGKFAMRQDLIEHAELLERNQLVRHFIAKEAGFDDGIDVFPPEEIGDRLVPGEYYCPMPADSSQLRAVLYSAQGKTFMLDGPPGTGKSQTITNIIAHNLAIGRRILFVAQKETALSVVKRRLDSVGLSSFCLELFAEKSDRAQVMHQLEESLSVAEKGEPESWRRIAEELKSQRRSLDDYANALHFRYPNGLSAYDCYARLFHKGAEGRKDLITADCLTQSEDSYREQREALRILAREYMNFGTGAALSQFPGLVQPEVTYLYREKVEARARDLARSCAGLQEALHAAVEQFGVGETTSLVAIKDIVELLSVVKSEGTVLGPLSQDGETISIEILRDALNEIRSRQAEKATARNTFAAVAARLADWDLEALARLDPRAVRVEIAAVGQSGLISKIFHLKEKELLRKYAHVYKGPGPLSQAMLIDALAGYECYADAKRRMEDFADVDDAGAQLDPGQVSIIDNLMSACALHEATLVAAGEVFDLEGRADDVVCVVESAQAVLANLGSLNDVISYRKARAHVVALGLEPMARVLESGEVLPRDLVETFDDAYYTHMLWDVVRATGSTLYGFNSRRHESIVTDFAKSNERYNALTKEIVYALAASRYPGVDGTLSESERRAKLIINQEINRSRGRLTIRRLLKEAGDLIYRYKPCFLMTPESVAQFMAMDVEPFDLVIFDEASQLKTCETVGVMARGRQVIVTGDPRQMPPTSVAERSQMDNGEDAEAIDDMESLLDDCRAAEIATVSLNWHYRSQHESLIAFSNRKYYQNDLNTFPSVACSKSLGVRFHFVPTGVYEGGVNPNEAHEVVKRLVELARAPEFHTPEWKSEDNPLVGIITFNFAQKELVGRTIKNVLACDPELAQILYERKQENANLQRADDPIHEKVGYVVKNLENCQGDEADVVIFSLACGPDVSRFDADGNRVQLSLDHFRSQVSDLGKKGGERKLNVAITRARKRLEVFSSIRAAEYVPPSSGALGLVHFQEFLAAAEEISAQTRLEAVDAPAKGLPEIIATFLSGHGYQVIPNVGSSQCKIDLAVVNPFDDTAFLLGIECDGPTYYFAHMVDGRHKRIHYPNPTLDRDVQRAGTLKRAGWNVCRVWSAEWFHRRGEAEQRLLSLLDSLKEKAKTAYEEKARAQEMEAPGNVVAIPVDEAQIDSALSDACAEDLPEEGEMDASSSDVTQEAASKTNAEQIPAVGDGDSVPEPATGPLPESVPTAPVAPEPQPAQCDAGTGLPLTEAALAPVRSPGALLLDGVVVRTVTSWKDCYLALLEKLAELDGVKFGALPDQPPFRRFFVRVVPHRKYPDCYTVKFGPENDVRAKEIGSKSYFYMPTYVVHNLLKHFGIELARVAIRI